MESLHLDPPLLQLQNTKKLYRTKNNCVKAQLGQILDRKIQRQKTQLPFLKGWAQKQGTALNTIEGWANHLSPTSSPTLAYTSPQGTSLPPPLGSLLLVFTHSCSQQGSRPNKAFQIFFIYLFILGCTGSLLLLGIFSSCKE